MFWSAEALLRQSLLLSDHNAHILESLLKCLLAAGRATDAADVVNKVNLDLIKSEQDSTARKIVQWAADDYEFAKALEAGRLKLCVELIARYPSNTKLTLDGKGQEPEKGPERFK